MEDKVRANLDNSIKWAAAAIAEHEQLFVVSNSSSISKIESSNIAAASPISVDITSSPSPKPIVQEHDTNTKETIYVIPQVQSGSIVGIIREALGLVQNTIRVVGLSFLGGPLLFHDGVGRIPIGFTRINETHFKLVSTPLVGGSVIRNNINNTTLEI
jgi:hypothetical protein